MTNKQTFCLCLTLILCAALFAFAQTTTSGPILLPAQTSVTGCAWPPATVATVTNGLALCPLNLAGNPALAIAVNGGPFTQVPMGVAAAGVTSFNGRTGAVTLTDADVLGTGLKVATTVTTTSTSTATSTPQ